MTMYVMHPTMPGLSVVAAAPGINYVMKPAVPMMQQVVQHVVQQQPQPVQVQAQVSAPAAPVLQSQAVQPTTPSQSPKKRYRQPRVGHSGDKRSGRSPPRDTDWICKSCHNCNWESRLWCKRCGTTKPKTPEFSQSDNKAPLIVPTSPLKAKHSLVSLYSSSSTVNSSSDEMGSCSRNDSDEELPPLPATFHHKLEMLVATAQKESPMSEQEVTKPSKMLSLLQLES
eukprot:TRINITY_DN814_c0_g1_i1.p1 TRINITY_DN814_c0_g1~~TRINITY_DN814_c0_g1_i1.p1  ORF type:complete len:227 (+),score=41.65 TRINITY_DN814_c0_g1_i1:64-744(+)